MTSLSKGMPSLSSGIARRVLIPVAAPYFIVVLLGFLIIASAGSRGHGEGGGPAVGFVLLSIVIALISAPLIYLRSRREVRSAMAPFDALTEALRIIPHSRTRTSVPIADAHGEVARLGTAASEIAEYVERLVGAREAAELSMRSFVAEAGHELRTPLTVLLGYVDLLKRGAIGEQALALRILDSMAGEGARMRLLIDKMLMLARMDEAPAPALELVDVAELFDSLISEMQAADPLQPITVTITPGLVLRCDRRELRSAIVNLIENARKYAPGSRVEVDAAIDGSRACIAVRDFGPGMSPEEQEHAFDRFYRGPSRGEVGGSGLGLAIVRRIAERAGGHAELESAPGAGTTVKLILPRAVASALPETGTLTSISAPY